MGSGTCVHTLRGHNDEILDVSFNTTGSKLVTASADGNCRVYNTMTGACHGIPQRATCRPHIHTQIHTLLCIHYRQTGRHTYFQMYHISILFPLLHILFSIECMYVVCVVCVDNINAYVCDFFSVYDMHIQPFWPATRARFPRWLSIPRAPAYLLPPGSPHLYRTPTSVVYMFLIHF